MEKGPLLLLQHVGVPCSLIFVFVFDYVHRGIFRDETRLPENHGQNAKQEGAGHAAR